MKNKIFSLLFLIISGCIYSQTYAETANWIQMNAGSQSGKYNNYVQYDSQNKKLIIGKIYNDVRGVTSWVMEINPKDVSFISLDQSSINSEFKGVIIHFNKSSIVKNYFTEGNSSVETNVEISKRPAISIQSECDLEKIKKIKKAYINLFRQLGVNVKDGDAFFD